MTAVNNIIINGMSFALPLFIMAIGGIYSERHLRACREWVPSRELSWPTV